VIAALDLDAKDRERLNSGRPIRAGQGNVPADEHRDEPHTQRTSVFILDERVAGRGNHRRSSCRVTAAASMSATDATERIFSLCSIGHSPRSFQEKPSHLLGTLARSSVRRSKSTAPGSLFFQIDLIGTFVAREPHRENDGNMPSAASTSAGALSEAQFQCAVIFLRR
jgi:hypothetical protein